MYGGSVISTGVVVAPVVFTPVYPFTLPTLYVLSVSLDTSSTFLDMINGRSLATPEKKEQKSKDTKPPKKHNADKKKGKRFKTEKK